MSPHQIIAVAVRLFVVSLLAGFVLGIPIYYAQATTLVDANISLTFYFVIAVLAAVILFAMWRFPLTIARKLLPSAPQESAETTSPDLWLAMGCALIGLWFIQATLPWLVYDLGLYLDGFVNPEMKAKLAQYLVQISISLWLIFGAKGFRKLFWWVRNAGHSQLGKPD